jgi:four helix bundle protein
MEIRSYRDLRVWQASMDLVEEVYRLTLEFPKAELFNLTTGIRRAAITIPTRIAEGHASEQLRDYLFGLDGAQKSLATLQTQIEVAGRLGYLPDDAVARALAHTESLAKQLYALRNALLRNG